MFFSTDNLINTLTSLVLGLFMAVFIVIGLFLLAQVLIIWYRNKNREKDSLDSTLLQVTMPRDNEIKIDAAEQLFTSFASMRKSGKLGFLKLQPALTFEIVGLPQDIRFYVNTPNKYKDLVEKQINGSYPDAEIKVVEEKAGKPGQVIGNEYNIFSKDAKVAFSSLKLKSSDYIPIKVY